MMYEALGYHRTLRPRGIVLIKCIKSQHPVVLNTIHRQEAVGKMLRKYICNKLLREDSGMELMEKVCPGGKPI